MTIHEAITCGSKRHMRGQCKHLLARKGITNVFTISICACLHNPKKLSGTIRAAGL